MKETTPYAADRKEMLTQQKTKEKQRNETNQYASTDWSQATRGFKREPKGDSQYQMQQMKCLVCTWQWDWVRKVQQKDDEVAHEIHSVAVSRQQ